MIESYKNFIFTTQELDQSLAELFLVWTLYFIASSLTFCFFAIKKIIFPYSLFVIHWIRLIQPLSFRFLNTGFDCTNTKYVLWLSLFVSGIPIGVLWTLPISLMIFDINYFSSPLYVFVEQVIFPFTGWDRVNIVLMLSGVIIGIGSCMLIVLVFIFIFLYLPSTAWDWLTGSSRNNDQTSTSIEEKQNSFKRYMAEELQELEPIVIYKSLKLAFFSFCLTYALFKLSDVILFAFNIYDGNYNL